MNVSVPRSSDRHGLVLRLLHWLTVALVVLQLTLAGLNAWLYEPRPILAESLVQAHISSGAVLLALTIIRIAVRTFGHSALPSISSWPAIAATVQLCLYFCLLMLPVSGYVHLAALGFPSSHCDQEIALRRLRRILLIVTSPKRDVIRHRPTVHAPMKYGGCDMQHHKSAEAERDQVMRLVCELRDRHVQR